MTLKLHYKEWKPESWKYFKWCLAVNSYFFLMFTYCFISSIIHYHPWQCLLIFLFSALTSLSWLIIMIARIRNLVKKELYKRWKQQHMSVVLDILNAKESENGILLGEAFQPEFRNYGIFGWQCD